MTGTGVVILAGGRGRRMGGGKPERPFRGRRLIDPVLDRVAAWSVPAVICVRERDQVAGSGLDQIIDRQDVEGPLAGLLSAFSWAQGAGLDHVLTLPCDTPFLPENVLPKLRRASIMAGAPAVAFSAGRRHPVCAVWPVVSAHAVAAYAGTGRTSLSGALSACQSVDVCWTDEQVDRFCNINTMEELAGAGGELCWHHGVSRPGKAACDAGGGGESAPHTPPFRRAGTASSPARGGSGRTGRGPSP
ncbi:molybdenum cofactor guanylyltransferase [Maricaulis sp. CAU 1757]